MIFNWQNYPQTGGVTGQPTVDPSQLQQQAAPGMNGEAVPPPPTASQQAGQTNATQGTPVTGGGVSMDDFNRAWQASSYPGTVEGLKQFYASDPKWAAAGVTLGGSKGDKVYGPGGSYWGDYVIAAGSPGGGTGKSIGSGPSAGGGQFGGGNLSSLGYNFGDAMTKFTPPTAEEALNYPGMQFALSEANRMGQNSAAAKGTLLNGRFQQALNASNIQNAEQGYNNVYNQAYQTFTRNQDAPFDKNLSLAKLGAPA
jgi:hypothetical protein